MPRVATAALLFSLSMWHLNSEGIDGTSDAPSCQREEAESLNDADVVLQMQTRVFIDPSRTSGQKVPVPTSNLPVTSEPVASKPAAGKNFLDQAEAVTAAESIIREGLREAVSDLRGEWQQRLEKLKESEQKAENGQEASSPLMDFRGVGAAPSSMVVESMKPHAVGKDFLQIWTLAGQSASINVMAAVLGVIFAFFLLRKLLIVWQLRASKSQAEAALRAETNASAKLDYLLNLMGFDPSVEEEGRIEHEMKNTQSIKSPVSDSEEEPEAECSVDTTVKAWVGNVADESVGGESITTVVVVDSDNFLDASNLA